MRYALRKREENIQLRLTVHTVTFNSTHRTVCPSISRDMLYFFLFFLHFIRQLLFLYLRKPAFPLHSKLHPHSLASSINGFFLLLLTGLHYIS